MESSGYLSCIRGEPVLAIISLVNESAREVEYQSGGPVWDASAGVSAQCGYTKPYFTLVS